MFSHQRSARPERASLLESLLLCLTLSLAMVAFAPAAWANSRTANLAEMTASAGRIVHGRITQVRAGTHPNYNHIAVTFVTLDVIEMLKGPTAPRITFMQYAGGQGMIRNVHLPNYRAGEEVLLFLYPESRYGFTSPIGEGQGKFLVRPDARGQRVLLNERGNRSLFERLDASKMQSRLSLNQTERSLLARPGGAAEVNSFRSMVRKLAGSKLAPSQLATN
jgi:hypothetical protein